MVFILQKKYKHAFHMLFRNCPCVCCQMDTKASPYSETFETSYARKTSTSTVDGATLHMHVNGRSKKYMRVNNTEQSFV